MRTGFFFLKKAARARGRGQEGLAGALEHFIKVAGSYEPGLFHCYDVKGLERTNNELEQLFGSQRHHERRCTGQKRGSPSLVVRGAVRLVAAVATRLRPCQGEELAPRDLGEWRQKRAELGRRQRARAQHRRFRRDPDAYLRELEERLSQLSLPS